MSGSAADIIIHGGMIFDPETLGAVPASLAIRNGIIAARDTRDRLDALAGPHTRVLHIPGTLIIPGFHDFHIHLYAGSLTCESVDLHTARSEREAAEAVASWAAEHTEHDWIVGFNWYHVFWEDGALPRRESLDRFLPDRPVFLFNAEYHGAWVNSAALRICGIDERTPDPPFGRIERDSVGKPTGFLYETAMGLAGKKALDLPAAGQKHLLEKFLSRAAAAGVTSVHDMIPLPGLTCGNPELYRQFEEEGKLGMRIFLEGDLAGSLDEARAFRDWFTTPMVRFSGLKQFVDGVATTYTAFLVDPYSDRRETRGGTLVPVDELASWVQAADAEGFRIRLHACGDGAVRTALDCYEAAGLVNGRRDSRHTIEHIEALHPDDAHRFRELGVIASIQPEHLAMTERYADSPYLARMGPERLDRLWPNRSLQEDGALVCYGSDFPIVDIDPLKGVYRAVSRLHNDGNPPEGWTSSERVSPAMALGCYTRAGSRGSFMESSLGLIEPGYIADIAVLDRNILACDPEEIRETRNILTLSNGRIIYQAI